MSANASSDGSTDEDEVNRNFEAETQLIIETDTLPKKSAERYLLVYETYQKWKTEHKNSLSQSEEDNVIVYFKSLQTRLSPATLWSVYSMLKNTLNTRENIDLSKYYKLINIIRNKSKGYKPKKSAVFTWDEIMKFMNDAPDHEYLGLKVTLIFGICGATRCKVLKDLGVADVEDLGNKYFVTISDSKNGLARQFVIGDLFYERVKKYISLKPTDFTTERFFIQYHKGKCQRQVIGRNTIGLIPKNIAEYLELNNPKRYTGHCFRRTSATLLSNSGANTTMLKQLGGWKSTEIAQTYVQNSLKNRQKIFDNITHAAASNASTSNAQSNPRPSTSKNSAASAIRINENEASILLEIGCDDFHEEFEVDNDALAELEKLIPPEGPILPKEPTLPKEPILLEEPKQSSTLFNARNKKKIIVNANSKSIKPTHFMSKPPISVFQGQKENEPPIKRNKFETTETDNQASDLTSTHSAKIKDSNIKYENCVFHGNIINNFYYSQINDQAS